MQICIRCSKDIETDLDIQTGVCSDCWEDSDYLPEDE